MSISEGHPPSGTHVVIDGTGVSFAILNDLTALLYSLELAVAAAGATIVGRSLHRFYPQGCSCVVVLKESHFSIHTYPEHGVYMADFFTCGDGDPTDACIELAEGLGGEYTLRTLPRGCPQ